MSRASALAVLYMGVAASDIGYLLYNRSIERVGPTRTSSIVSSLQPVLVSVLTLLFFDEPITVTMVLSTLVIVSGVNLALGR